MKIAVIHDYADALRKTRAFPRLQGHEVMIYNDPYLDPARVVEQVDGCDALLLTQQRVNITRDILRQLPALKFISQICLTKLNNSNRATGTAPSARGCTVARWASTPSAASAAVLRVLAAPSA